MNSKMVEQIKNRIDYLSQERERLQAIAEKTTPTLTDMPRGGEGNPREEAICKMADCGVEIDKLKARLITIQFIAPE